MNKDEKISEEDINEFLINMNSGEKELYKDLDFQWLKNKLTSKNFYLIDK